MTKASGYILNVDGVRRDELLEAFEFGETPSESVPTFSHNSNIPLIAFVGFKRGSITHLADARLGQGAGTRRRRLSLRNMVALQEPVLHRDIARLVNSRVRISVTQRLSEGGLLPPASFDEIIEAFRKISPDSRRLLDRFSEERKRAIDELNPADKVALAYQKETVTTALALADFDRHIVQDWQPPSPDEATSLSLRPPSFLDGLPTARRREDSIIIEDLMQVPGFEFVRPLPYGAALFEADDGTRLSVVMANRTALEEQLGADLIYFNETYQAYVIIQYKAMERADNGPVFRLPNKDLRDEIVRMDAALDELRKCPPNTHRHGFRLMENPFFLKLCPRVVFNPDDAGLSKGMYLPLDYWRLIESDTSLMGPKGGRQVNYENVGRYLDNTGFIALMSKAWLGTTPPQSDLLRPIIREAIATGRLVTIAVKTEGRRIASGMADAAEDDDE